MDGFALNGGFRPTVLRPFSLARALLAMLATPNIITPPEFGNNGIPTYSTFQGVNLVCNPAFKIQYPTTILETQSLVYAAISLNTTIKAFGSRHSLTDVICTKGIPLDMKKINHVRVNSKENTVTVGSGAEVFYLLETLHKYNRTLITIPSFGGITIGGALGTGSHGSSLKHPTSISDQVVSMVIVDGTGAVKYITDPNDLKAFRVHLGLLGILYEVTLRTVPEFKLHTVNYPMSDEILDTNHILNLASDHDWFQLWWFPSSHSVVLSRGNMVPIETPGNAKINLLPNFPRSVSVLFKQLLEIAAEYGDRTIFEIIQEITRHALFDNYVPFGNPLLTEDGIHQKNPGIGLGYEMMGSQCPEVCPWDHGPNASMFVYESSVSVDLNEFTKVIKTLKKIFNEAPIDFPVFGILMRFSPPSDALLAMQNGRKTLHIDWVSTMRFDPENKPRAGLATVQALQQALVFNHGGRPHWAKNGKFYHTFEVINKSLGNNMGLFAKYMKEYDPQGIFLNDFGNRMYGKRKRSFRNIGLRHCALQDDCICEKNEDCGFSENIKCEYLNGFKVCKN